MKSKENLVFLGMMGSGKSSIGSLVAKKLNLNFIDIDNEIEKKFGMSIKEIFNSKGENYFRELEEKVTLKKLKLNTTVISLGGGAFVNQLIRKEVLKKHISFWLNWSDQILLNRIRNSAKRPIAYKSSDDKLIEIINNRSDVYSKALYEIKCDNLSKKEIVEKVLRIYETY